MIYEYRHPDGRVVEREFPIGKAAKTVRFDGARCERIMSMPSIRPLNDFERGAKPSRSKQLPDYYGFRDRDGCYRDWINKRGADWSPELQQACVRHDVGPTPAEQNEYARNRAAKAGALGEFDRKGRAVATTKRGEFQHIARGREMGDQIGLDR